MRMIRPRLHAPSCPHVKQKNSLILKQTLSLQSVPKCMLTDMLSMKYNSFRLIKRISCYSSNLTYFRSETC